LVLISFVLAPRFFHFSTIKERINIGIWIPNRFKKFILKKYPEDLYYSTKLKVDYFISQIESDNNCEIILNEDELNCLCSKGVNLNKYDPGYYIYYTLSENLVLENFMKWPDFSAPDACRTITKKLTFDMNSEVRKINVCEFEGNGYAKNDLASDSIENSILLLLIFGGLKSVPRLYSQVSIYYGESPETERGRYLIRKLSDIKIKDNLILLASK
jgi:hypothetical protein